MKKLLIFGDSITWGAWDSMGGWPARLKQYANEIAIQNEYENYSAVYSLGIPGNNTEDLLLRYKSELSSRLDEDSNATVVFAIGINDSQFETQSKKNRVPLSKFNENLNTLITISKNKDVKNICFIGLTPVDDDLVNPMPWKPTHGYSNDQIKNYNELIQKVAKKNNKYFIDPYEVFINQNYLQLLSDGLHPNTRGHELLYNLIKDGLKSLNILH